MIGALAGDIIGSVYEWNISKASNLSFFSPSRSFTDDSVLTIALADAILTTNLQWFGVGKVAKVGDHHRGDGRGRPAAEGKDDVVD